MLGYLIVENVEKNVYDYSRTLFEISKRREVINFSSNKTYYNLFGYTHCFTAVGTLGDSSRWWAKEQDIRFIGKNGQLFLDF